MSSAPDPVLTEAARLWRLGYAVHWLMPKSKRPVEKGWTTGPRKSWEALQATYQAGYNVGVRLGSASPVDGGYLAVIDVDVKGQEERHRTEAVKAAQSLLDHQLAPKVLSGRGNGSRHYYCVTDAPFKPVTPARSQEVVTVHMPSKKPSKVELAELTPNEIAAGFRLGPAWEVSLYSEGRQVVAPPSVHPDTGRPYRWAESVKNARLPILKVGAIEKPGPSSNNSSESRSLLLEGFKVSPVEIAWLPLSDEMRAAIVEGVGVTDRSGFLLKASTTLFSAGLTQNEVLTVLTDPKLFLGAVGYEHAQTKSREAAAAWVYRYTVKKVEGEREERAPEKMFGKVAPQPPRKLTEEEQREQANGLEEERSWKQDLVRTQNGALAKNVINVVTILQNEVGPDVIRRDEFAFRDAYSCDTPWGGKKDAAITDDDVVKVKYWLSEQYQIEPSTNTISDALLVMATQHAFDPVRDWLDALPEWDGMARLDTWLASHFEGKGEPEYLAQVFRKWMVAMVMRIYEPGAKFDWMPIFEGAQGVGKSSFGRILVGDRYFLDWLPNLTDKDSALSLQGMWAVEMGELSQFRRNELESIKAFITRTVDKLRPPYGRKLIESSRRCVFFGTTNRKNYLTDETGNRRFKPVVVGNLDFKTLRKERKQLFAEARHLWLEKKETALTLELVGEARVYEKVLHKEKMVEDDSNSMEEMMAIFVEKVEAGNVTFNLTKFRLADLFQGGGALEKWKPENRNLQLAAKMVTRMGGYWRFIRGDKYWCYPTFLGATTTHEECSD